MKKLLFSFIIAAGIIGGLVSCDKDMNNPNASIIGSFNIITPNTGTSLTLNPNNFNATALTVQWTSANFGYSASVKYVLQIISSADHFDTPTVVPQVIPLDTYNEYTNSTYEKAISTTILNGKLKAIGVTIGVVSSFKMRVYAQPSSQLDSSVNGLREYSQEVAFTSNVYDPIDEAPKLYVIGNFGSTSTFANWDINMNGTSNSPLIYSPLKDGVYEGFVYMNVASPQFKFANPTATTLDIKGLKTQYTQTTMASVSLTTPLGNFAGEIMTSADVSTSNIITPVAALTGAGTYFIKADWVNNKYTAIKRLISLKGIMTSQVNKYFTYDTDPTSPTYRMFTIDNVTLSAGTGYIQLKDNSSALADKVERFGIDNNVPDLQISPDALSSIKNKMKLGGQSQFKLLTPGNYKVVLDLRNSANYNLRFVQLP
jgi:hypothetical protein